jgi:hypothetical protein
MIRSLVAVAATLVMASTGARPPVVRARDVLPIAIPARSSSAMRLTQAQVDLAERLARARWGPTRCADGIVYRYSRLGYQVIAQAHWWFYTDSPKVYRGCYIVFSVDPRRVPTRFAYYCAAVFHEFGHLSGLGHSKNPYSVMYPVISRKNVPGACWLGARTV